MKKLLIIILSAISLQACGQDDAVMMDSSEIQMNGIVHETLSDDLLKRIKATTIVFEIVDGISYEQAVDLYKRDLDPEANLVIWEEMARVYLIFCNDRCHSESERKDVYTILLLRSMMTNKEVLVRYKPETLTDAEVQNILSEYKLDPEPVAVMQK